MLQLFNLSKTFYKNTVNEHRAICGLDLTVASGDFVTVIGSNGAGKSTLLNLIGGNLLAEEGAILLDGKNITYEKDYHRAKYMGRLFQDPMKGTAPSMTIEENLALAYSSCHRETMFQTHRLLSRAISKKSNVFFRDALACLNLGLENRMNTKMGMLSGGQRQAVTLLMATIVKPKLLLLDEHTAALDPATAETILSLTKEIVEKDGITTIMVTHNMQDALQLGNRTIMMDAGKIILDVMGEERRTMTVELLREMFQKKKGTEPLSDRMLLA